MGDEMVDINPPVATKQMPASTDSVEAVIIEDHEKIDVEAHMLLSCLVMWCCNICFGSLAFFAACSGRHKPYEKMRRMIRISRCLNVTGVVITCLILCIFLALYFTYKIGNFLPYKRIE